MTQANPYVERLIGSVRRECLDHVIVLNESGLRRILNSYFEYYEYEHSRTHLSLGKDAPIARPISANRNRCDHSDSSGRRIALSLRTNRRLKGLWFPGRKQSFVSLLVSLNAIL